MNRKHLVVVAFVSAMALSFATGVILSNAQGPQPQSPSAVALGSAFTYQGQLKNSNAPVNGSCDIAFRLFDAPSGGNQNTFPITQTLALANGYFTTMLDFGAAPFNGDARWLDMQVRCPSGTGAFTPLTRQALTAAPYALALRGLRTEQTASSPNIIGGYSGNLVDGFSSGSSLLGGGNATNPNHIAGNYSVIAGGSNNQLLFSDDSFIGGGFSNTITSHEGVIAGGGSNIVSGDHAVILGGTQNQALGDDSTIGGGNRNVVTTLGNNAVIGGGFANIANGPYSVIPGGDQNQTFGYYSFAGGLGARALANGDFVWADSVGVPFTSTNNDQFIVRAAGGFGIGTNAPATQLHVVASINANSAPSSHVAVIENSSTGTNADVLMLKLGFTGNPTSSNNFITFFRGNNTSVGAFEGNGTGGVVLAGPGSDYAEWVPRLNANEQIDAGDIVAVVGGHITKDTRDATQVMVVSTGPIVVGNDPGEDARANYARVAFIGQAMVKVRGPVRAGDFIVPSGANDGIGIAVAPEQISAAQFAQVVGTAWDESADADVKSVRVAVGLLQHDPTVKRLVENNASQAEALSALEARVAALERTKQASSIESSWLDVRTFVFGLVLAALVGYQVRRERKP